jgi:hypothetical protein
MRAPLWTKNTELAGMHGATGGDLRLSARTMMIVKA